MTRHSNPTANPRVRSELRRLAARSLAVAPSELRDERSLIALGLDSLAAVELQGAISASLGVELTLDDLLAGPNLVELERLTRAALERLTRAAQERLTLASAARPAPVAAPAPAAAAARAPLSHGQRALWLLDRITPGNPAFIIAGAARLRGELDVPRLRQALEALVRRHPSLRSSFELDGGEAVQVVHDAAVLAFVEADAAAWEEAHLGERLAAAAYQPFDLARGPLLRVALFHRTAAEHLLVLAVHHVVADFWSLGLLVGELSALWQGQALPPPPTYGDFVRAEAERLARPETERLWSYWNAALAPLPPPLDLPADRPRPPLPSYRGAARALRLDHDLSQRLPALGRRAGATPFMTLLAAYLVLLHRHSGQQDLLVGTPTAGRGSPALAGLVGYCVNPVVVRGDLGGDPAFGELLGRVREAVIGALAHQGLPFPLLAERLATPRDPSRPPLFQAMFVLYRERRQDERGLGGFAVGAHGASLDLGPGLRLESLPLPRRSSQLDLTLLAAENGGRLACSLQFNSDLFDAATAERMLGHHFHSLLTAIAAGAEGPVSQLPLLAAVERHQLRCEWNATPWDAGGNDLMHAPFERQAARDPAAVALIDGGRGERMLSYGELDRRATRLARALRSSGVGPERRVGICAEPSFAMVAGLFAVLKAGGAYLPLDPALPGERLAQILADSGVEVALVDERLTGLLPATVRCLPLDGAGAPAEPAADAGCAALPHPDNAAYVVYTSGSTGVPKGVVVSHRAVANRLRFQVAADLAPGARVLQRTRLGFDVSVLEIFAPLWMGGSVVLVAPEHQQDAAWLARLVVEQQVTNATFPPAMYPALLADEAFCGCPSLRLLVTGSDRVPGDLPARLFAAFAGRDAAPPRFTARYGPTETTIAVAEWNCRHGAGGQSVPLGRPIAGARFHLLDRYQREVPLGVPGELCVAGTCLARGYLARPDLTAAAFIPDPFFRHPAGAGGRLYRTGDLARYHPDGVLEFLGRVDRQVKVRGFRLELGEVEAALAGHPEIREVAVVDRPEPATGGKRLVAYVVTRSAPGARAGDGAGDREPGSRQHRRWRAFLADRLPAYMVPAEFVTLPRLPLNANGKLDRGALPEPLTGRGAAGGGGAGGISGGGGVCDEGAIGDEAEAAAEPPRSPLEEVLATLWGQVLGRERVGIRQDFFELGGHSLLATQLASRVREVLGIELPVREIFGAPTVAGLAARLAACRQTAAGAPLPPVPPPLRAALTADAADAADAAAAAAAAGEAGPAPLSFAQERLWLLAQLEPASPAYHIPVALRLLGRLQVPALAAGFGAVVRRHEALRTGISVEAGRAVQRALPARPVALPVVDLSGVPAAAATGSEEVTRLARAAARRPFDLARGPLLRTGLLRLGAEEHVLLLTVHHIAWDGWSTGIFLRELAAVYGAAAASSPPRSAAGGARLPEPRVQYADYARWQREWFTEERLERSLAFWRSRLAGAPGVIELPADRPRPKVLGHRGGALALAVEGALLARLGQLGRELGATLFMLLTAAFNLLLHRLTGQDDVLIGFPIANRTAVETEALIGVFVNTLVLRSTLAAAESFAQAVARTRQDTLEAYEHQDLPFERLVAELAPERSLSHAPLFQVMLALQNAPAAAPELPGLRLEPLAVDAGIARFDLVLSLAPVHGGAAAGLAGRFEYSAELFDAATARRLAEHFHNLLAALAHDPRRPASELSLLSPAERQQHLEWNDTAAAWPSHEGQRCLHELVEAQVRRTPDAVAVIAADGSDAGARAPGAAGGIAGTLTYHELNARANRLARHLRGLGVGPETIVAICLERSLALPIGLLAILKAGGAYLPLDPDYPRDRLRYMLADSRVPVLLTDRRLAAWLDEGGAVAARTLCLDAPANPWRRRSGRDLHAAVEPDNPAYVIYTSGSTGRPKGTANAHLGVVNRLLWMQRQYRLTAADGVLQKTPASFDVSVWELFWPLLVGARLVMARPGGHRDPAYLWQAIARHEITTLHFVPSMLRAFLAFAAASGAPEDGAAAPRPAAGLRQVMASGEALPYDLAQRFEALLAAPLHNLYGPTEAAIDVTHWACVRDDRRRLVPIGRPVANTRIRLLDRHGQETPIGVAGELHIGGVQLTRGYLGRPRLTAQRFVPDPRAGQDGAEPGARLYRTGDLARHLPDGAIDYLGRNDRQVKVRGFRIELGEVEAALAALPEVQAAAVAVAAGSLGVERLVAYVVLRRRPAAAPPAARPTPAELRRSLARRLPEIMVPGDFVFLDSLPLTPSGKLDRRALPAPAPASGSAQGSDGGGGPRTPVEELVAGAWEAILGVERVGIADNFFELGGHSLLGTQLISRLRQLFAVELGLRDLFEAPTLAALASRVAALRDAGGTAPLPPLVRLPPARRTLPLPVSFGQRRLWFIDQLQPGSAAYHMAAGVRLVGALSLPALAGALGGVVRRHEILRTTFVAPEGEPLQEIHQPGRCALPQVDLAGLPGPRREPEAARWASAEARRPFALSGGPLLRAGLLRMAAGEHLLLLVMHHIVGDGWSVGVLGRELGALYGAALAAAPSPSPGGDALPSAALPAGDLPAAASPAALPELAIQYADFACWQRRWLSDEALQPALAFWRRALAGAPPALELPVDRPRRAARSGRGGTRRFALPADLARRLAALGRRQGATLFMTLLAAFDSLLGRWTGQSEVCVGTPVAGRTRAETEGLVGLFVNTLVLRAQPAGETSFALLLDSVREAVLAAHAHQELPFEKLVEELAPRRGPDRSPLFQAMFALQHAPPLALELPGLRSTLLPLDTGSAMFDLSLTLAPAGDGLQGALVYDAELFDGATIGRLAGHLQELLAGLLADPCRRLAELKLLSAAERHQLEIEWNDSAMAGAAPRSAPWRLVPEDLAAQAERTPEATAVVCGSGRLTYRQLDAAANRLAHRLRALGVGPEVPVGLCLERSLDLAVGVLAILKAGGAFLPLEPTYPAERLAYILADSRAPVVVSRRPLPPGLAPHARNLCLDGSGAQCQPDDGLAPPARIGPANLAYVIYTSGSTGEPKAVLVEHGSLANLLRAARREVDWNAADVVPCLAPFSFDIFLFELLGPLLAGGSCVLVPLQPALDLPSLLELLPRCTRLHAVPALLREIVDATEAASAAGANAAKAAVAARHPLPLLRTIFTGGDLVPASLRAAVVRVFPHAELRVLYGPTESTILATCYRQPREQPVTGSPIGRPLGNVLVRVSDRHGQPVPIGVAGELSIGGPGVARGYLGRADATAERYLPGIAWTAGTGGTVAAGGRVYRTGDLVRYLPDGNLEFLGRTDAQVKIRGVRIEPGEIEAALLAHPAVRAAVVAVRRDAAGEPWLVAYVVGDAAADELRAHLRRRLPAPLVPAAFAALDALPLSAHGKVDRQRLPEPWPDAGETGRPAAAAPGGAAALAPGAAAAAGTWAEEMVAAIWADVLGISGVSQIDRETSFFDLGGHSLLATRVISRLRAACGVELALRELFAEPTVAGLAARVERARAAGGGAPAPPLVRVGRERALPLSYAQQRLWFLDQLEPASSLYNVPAALRLTGPLSAAALESSLAGVVRRHEALRASFAAVGGEPVQVIHDEPNLRLARIDLSALPEPAREAQGSRLAAGEARRPFDLRRAPQLRAVLLRLAAEEHLLLLTLHHIASDAWSAAILIREVAALYAAALARRPPRLPELPVQYADYACWQRAWLSGEVLAAQVAWWRQRLAGMPAALDLPADRPRPPVLDAKGSRRTLRLSAEVAGALSARGRREGATLFMLLLAAFQALLGRYSGQRQLVVGSAIANRNRAETEGLIGFFVNTLALAGDLAGEPSWRELLARVREECLGAYAHQDLPFEKLVEELTPRRDPTRTPLFQVMLALQNAPQEELALPGLRVLPVGREQDTARFDLTVTAVAAGPALTLHAAYRQALFDGATIARLLGHFERALASLAAAPEARVWEVPLLGTAEAAQLLVEWNDTARVVASGASGASEASEACGAAPACLHELFAAQAARAPDAVAVCCEERQLTYGELAGRAARLAARLRRLGVGPDVPVGLLVEPGLAAMAGLFGILTAGGAYVPLDPEAPPERLTAMLEDSGIALVLTRRDIQEPQEPQQPQQPEQPQQPAGGPPPARVAPENLAYVLHTSGSTGRPKGVAVAHRSVVNHVRAVVERLDFAPGAHFAMVQPLTVDSCVTHVFVTLTTGGCLHVIPRRRALSAPALAEAFARHPIDCLKLAPSHLLALRSGNPAAAAEGDAAEGDAAPGGGDALLPRRWLIVGGEPSQLAWLRQLQADAPSCAIFNNYGPTETTVGMLMYRVSGEGGPGFSPVAPLGRPLANTRAYLLDEHLRPALLGTAGKLYIGGECVSRGYLRRPDLTAERFLPDPWSPLPGARMYDSGDLMRHTPRGELAFLGRLDHQVKIRGFRVELGEIEAAVGRHPAVGEVVVRLWKQAPEGEALAAYVVGRGGAPAPGAAELRQFLAAKLPDYMAPRAVVPLAALPRTPHGKLNLEALPAPRLEREPCPPELAPRGPVAELLAGVYGDLLGREQVGAADSFFDLGGHSLLATRLLSRVRALFGVELELREIFEHPTVAELATRITAAASVSAASAASAGSEPGSPGPRPRQAPPPLVRAARRRGLPLSFAQQRLWFIEQLAPGSSLYNVPLALALGGRLDVAALRRSLGEIVRRHEVLRTRFGSSGGEPVQVICPWSPPPLPVVDLAGLPRRRRAATAAALGALAARRPFDLEAGPPLRLALLRLDGEEHLALATMHHIASDAWSKEILARELGELYRDGPAGLPELELQYADFAIWQRGWLAGEVLAAELAHWRRRLAGAPPLLDLPTDRPRPTVWSGRGASRPWALPPAKAAALARLARGTGATPFMVLLAALLAVLSRWTGQLDLSIGTPIAGRNRLETERLIGFFVNTLVLRVELAGAPSFGELVRRAREVALDAYLHQDLPFEKLVEEIHPQRSLAYSPLFQVMLVLQNAPPARLELPGLSVTPLRVEPARAKFDLTLSLTETPEGLAGSWEHSADLFDGATVARLAAGFELLLSAALADPSLRAADLPLLAAAERHQLLVDWNDTAASGGPRCLHQLFEARADLSPAAPALAAAGRELSYAEVEAHANRLAWHLAALGVGPEVRVALMLERTPEMVAAVLAILKAGGAYVPLDPSYPDERLAFLVEDSAAALLVTQESLAARAPAAAKAVICLDRAADRERIAARPAGRPPRTVDGGNLAYVIYTSGSSGTPKGVAVAHQGACRTVAASLPLFGLGGKAPSRLLQLSSLGFDASVLEIFMALASGARLHLLEQESRLAVASLGERLRAERITCLVALPSLLDAVPSAELPDLRTVSAGGEVCPPELAGRWVPGRTFLNCYGPTEISIYATAMRYQGAMDDAIVAIGRPLPGVRIRLLDAGLRPVPMGVVGEIHIAGVGVARGYLGRPALTAERFVPDPWAELPGERMYCTGDLGRYRPDGCLQYAGRRDRQVKIRGFRIEPEEIEAALARCADVREAAVEVREDPHGGRRLVAFVVRALAAAGTVAALAESLRRRLPGYMVPAHFVELAALPLTPHGKIDRQELSRVAVAPGRLAAAPYVAPRTPLELLLARVWEDLLQRSPIGVRESFFDLGGHSLLAVRLIARLRDELAGRELPLAVLFEVPTIEQLARRLEEGGAGGAGGVGGPGGAALPWSPLVPLQPRGDGEPFFCVHAIGGGVVRYYGPLARRLGDDQPFYAFQALGLDRHGEAPQPSIAELAARYVAAMREIRPFGPYFLGGASFGGLVAFEMAQQLRGQGEEVALLALIDTLLPGADTADPAFDEAAFCADMAQMLARQEGVELALDADELRGLPHEEMLEQLLARLRAAGLAGEELDLPWMDRYIAGFKARMAAASAYRPRRYPGEISLFRAHRAHLGQRTAPAARLLRGSFDDPALGWGSLAAQGVRVHQLRGTHETMLREPHVRQLASLLRWSIDRSRAAVPAVS